MSCSACYAKFSLIRREKTCDSCQLSYCSKCLINDEKSKKRLCRNCSKTKTAEFTKICLLQSFDWPSILSGSNINSIHGRHLCGGSKDFKPSSGKTFDDAEVSADDDLKNRLEKLKERGLDGLNGNIEERLAKLKGEEIDKYADHRHDWLMKPKPKKTQAEEAYDLLNEFCDENKISSKIMSPEEEIARRLAKLKGETFVSEASSSTVNDIDYDQDVNAYLKAYEQQKAGKESESSNKMYSNLLAESKRQEIHTIDQEIRNLMKKRGIKSKKVENSSLSDRETESGESDDESELEQVIEQALMTKDDEDELEDDTKYRFDAINRNQMRK